MNSDSIKIAIDFLGAQYFSNLDLSYNEAKESSVIKNGNKVAINYSKLVHVFYGLTLIKQNYKKQSFDIKIKNRFEHNGIMHDCSRNAVMNINMCKQMILVHALFGLNRMMLYTEETYEIPGEPYFGYFRGRYTKDELKELVEYSKSFGVELVPCIQTLSHLNQVLRWNNTYRSIKTSPQTLKIGVEKTYELIEKMIKTVKENFDTDCVHIGMDEAIDIGLFDYLENGTAVDKKTLLLNHLNRVVDICRKYGLKPIMWCDMFFKIDPKHQPDWYEFKGNLEDDVKNMIPEDVELIYWDYYHKDYEIYDRLMKTCKDTGREVMFGSGMVRWIGFVPNYNSSFLHCKTGLKAAIDNNIKDALATTWGDGGSECSVISSYPFLAIHSLFDYYGKYDDKKLDKLLKAVTSSSLSDWMLLQSPNEISGQPLLTFENPTKPFLYNDPLLGLFDLRAFDEYEERFASKVNALKKQAKKSVHFAYAYNSLAALCDLLSVKVTLGRKCREAYKANNKKQLKERLDDLKVCLKKLDVFIKVYKKQWLTENKAFGLEVTDGRLSFLKGRIVTAIERISDYLNGDIPVIEEFEQDVLPYDSAPNDEAHCYNLWNEITSANII